MHKTFLSLALLPLVFVPPQEPRPKEHDTVLGGQMKEIEESMKTLRKLLREPSGRDAALAALVEIQERTLRCKQLEPEAAQKLSGDERSAFVFAYRRSMVDFLALQLEVEAKLLDGDGQGAKETFERLRAMEDPAHERFAPEDD